MIEQKEYRLAGISTVIREIKFIENTITGWLSTLNRVFKSWTCFFRTTIYLEHK